MTENTYRISENIKRLFENVNEICAKSNRRFEDISIMGVTKTQSSEDIISAAQGGITLFGENRVQELIEKDITFKQLQIPCHIIGSLQTNKVKFLPPMTSFIQSVDSLKLAQEINKQYLNQNKTAKILIEVNIGQEDSKSGITKDYLLEFIYQLSELRNISVQGLMCIPPICKNDLSRRYFQEMHKLFVDISSKKVDNINMSVLSMGMSQDYIYAIQDGSNLIRVGQGIFGQRTYK